MDRRIGIFGAIGFALTSAFAAGCSGVDLHGDRIVGKTRQNCSVAPGARPHALAPDMGGLGSIGITKFDKDGKEIKEVKIIEGGSSVYKSPAGSDPKRDPEAYYAIATDGQRYDLAKSSCTWTPRTPNDTQP